MENSIDLQRITQISLKYFFKGSQVVITKPWHFSTPNIFFKLANGVDPELGFHCLLKYLFIGSQYEKG